MPPEDEDDESNAKWWGIGVVAVLLLAAVVWGIVKMTDSPPPAAKVEVTDVTGMEVEQATRALTNDGFIVATENEQRPDNKLKEGLVIATDPPAGEEVDEKTEITLIVSSGPEEVTIPDFDGFSYSEAKKVLEDKGLKVKK